MAERIDLDLSPLRHRLAASKVAIWNWQRGSARPRWRFMRQIADILKLPLPEVVKILWRENVGDPCPCGCGGETVFPDKFPNATTLAIEISCECGLKRIRKHYPAGLYHLQLCPKCARENRPVELTEFACIGYYVVETYRRCLKKKQLQRWEVNALQYRKERNPNSRFDKALGEYQCASCSNLERRWAQRIKALLEHISERHPETKLERIRTFEQVKELQRTHTRCMNPNLIEAGRKILTSRPRSSGYSAPGTTRAHLIRKWSGKDLPKLRFGLCIDCGKIAITTRKMPDFHKSCYGQWLGTPEGRNFQSLKTLRLKASLPPPRRGHPVTEENLKISYSWAIQHYLAGKSYREISQENGLSHPSVIERVESIIAKLPEPHLVSTHFHRTVKLLLHVSREASSHSIAALNG